jgi:mRNA-degrading endonuclease YafQ of YafQ-DinJ toxin-antitoxin module
MTGGYRYETLQFTETFLEDFAGRHFTAADRQRIRRALRLLDSDERHPSLRVHELQGPLAGVWSASASDELRITFERLGGGKKVLLTCTRHYQR